MFPQRRMTTDTPDGNYSQALNLFVRGEDGWVQMPSRSISLNDYMKQLIKAHNADIDTEGTPEEFDMTLCEHLFDDPETIEQGVETAASPHGSPIARPKTPMRFICWNWDSMSFRSNLPSWNLRAICSASS